MVRIKDCEVFYDLSERYRATFFINLYFYPSTELYEKKYDCARFSEFGYYCENDEIDRHYEPTEWTNYVIAEVIDTDSKYLEFEYGFYFDDEDDISNSLVDVNNEEYWNKIFDELKKCPISVPQNVRIKIKNKWNEYKEECLKKLKIVYSEIPHDIEYNEVLNHFLYEDMSDIKNTIRILDSDNYKAFKTVFGEEGSKIIGYLNNIREEILYSSIGYWLKPNTKELFLKDLEAIKNSIEKIDIYKDYLNNVFINYTNIVNQLEFR